MNRLLVCLALLLVSLPAPAAAAPDPKGKKPALSKKAKKLKKKLERASRKLKIPVEALAKVGGHRALSKRPGDLKGLCVDLHRRVDARNLPILIRIVTSTRLDKELRFAALALLPVYALEGDSGPYLELQATFRRLYGDEFQRVWEGAAAANHRLLTWFDLDQEVSELFVRTYRGKFYRKAQRAYRAILDFRHPELRAGIAQEALKEALEKRSRFGIKERQRAVRENGRRGAPLSAHQLADLLHADGTVAIACATALADLDDATVLPSLRKIGRTSSHVLRVPILQTRGRLQDASLVDLIGPTFHDDHARIQAALVRALVELRHKKVDRLLEALEKLIKDEALGRVLDLGRLRRGDPAVVSRLADALTGGDPDPALARKILATPHAVANPLVLLIAKSGAKPLEGLRPRALAEIGTRRIVDADTIAWVGSLCTGKDKTPLRLQAAATLVQAGAPKAKAKLRAALKDFKVVRRVDVRTSLGKARRFNGSHLGDVCRRWSRDRAWRATPILSKWLNPPPKKGKPAPKGAEGKPPKGTKTRGGRPPPKASPTPAKPPKWLRHAFVRRSAVEALGGLVWAAEEVAAGRGKSKWPKAPARLAAWSAKGHEALARALNDTHRLVRRAAIRALARLGGTTLEPGASLSEEDAAERAARAYLERAR